MDRIRSLFGGMALVAAITGLAACGAPAASGPTGGTPAQSAPSNPSAGSAPAAAPGAPKPGGVLLLAQRDTPENMNYYAGVFASQVVFNHFYEPLVAFDQTVDYRIDFPITPLLAEKWEQPDDKTWVFTLNKDAKWHNGKALTAEDVVWSFEHLRDPKNNYPGRSNIATIDTITAEPGNKVRMALKNPTPNFLVSLNEVVILPKHVYDEGGVDALGTKSMSTGPFLLESMDRTSRTIFKKNPNYWRKDKDGRQLPYLDGIQFTHNMDQSTQQAAFAAGKIDIFNFSDKAQMDAFLRRVKDVKVVKFQYALDPVLGINFRRPYMDKPEVRRALNLILDREEINQNFAGGEAIFSVPMVPAMKTGWTVPQEELRKRPGWRADKAADIAEAKRLLKQAGVPETWGPRLINRATFGNTPQGEQSANQFQRAGLKVDYAPLDDASFVREQRGDNWDLMLELPTNPDITRGYNYFHSKGASNFGKLADPELDKVLEQLLGALDPAEQKRLGKRAVDIILEKDYRLPVVTPAIYNLLQPWVNGWQPNYAIQVHLQGAGANLWIDTAMLPDGRK